MSKETKTVFVFALIFAVLAGFAFYFVNETAEKVEAKRKEIEGVQKQIAALQKEADQEAALIEELESLRVNFKEFVKILPAAEVATEERLMTMVQEKCERTQFTLDSYLAKGGKKGKKKKGKGAGFHEISVSLKAEGTYEQFLRFLNSLERHESFVRVNSFSCNPPSKPEVDEEGKETWPLDIQLKVSTFRYDSGGK
jgi:Tfp pilus assembly protein PilO